MPLIRSVVMLIAAFAMLLALGQGPRAYAAGIDRTAFSVHQDVDGCAPATMPDGQSERHDDGGCGKMHCCLGVACVFAGLPVTSIFITPVLATAPNPSAATAFLTGREVAPPLDPPKPSV